jgi:hypothetical protein
MSFTKMSFDRRGIILLVVIIGAILLFVGYTIRQSIQPVPPISADFDSASGSVTFAPRPGYQLHWARSTEGYLSLPDVDTTTTQLELNALDIPVNRHDFVEFYLESTGKNPAGYYITFEILHQSDTQFIIEYTSKTGETGSNTYDYNIT